MSRSSLLTWSLIVTLLASLVPTTQAQVTYGFESQPDSLLPNAVNEQIVVTDPAGDPGFIIGSGGPENPMDGSVDIISIAIAESEDKLRFSLKHRAYDPMWDGAQMAVPFTSYYGCNMNFGVNDDDRFGYAMDIWLDSDAPATGRFVANGYMWERNGDRGYGEWLGEIPVALVASDHIEVVFEKTPIRVGEDGRGLAVGDKITDVFAWCYHSSIVFGNYDGTEDPGEGVGSYKVTMASGSDVVAAAFVDDSDERAAGALTMPAGVTKRSSLLLTNLRSSRIIVNLTAKVVDAAGASVPGWTAVVAPVMEVPADSDQRATVIITSPAGAAHRDTVDLLVEVRPLGDDDTLKVKRAVEISAAPGPSQNVLYFHRSPWESCGICIDGQDISPIDLFGPGFMMNLLKQDPEFGEATVESKPARFQDWEDGWAALDSALSQPLRIASSDKIRLTLGLATDVERDVVVSVSLYADDGGRIGSGESTVKVGSSTTATVEMPTGPEVIDVPEGTYLWMSMDITEKYPVPGGSVLEGAGPGIDWVTGASSLTLPLLPLDQDGYDLTDGRALPTIQLRNGTERETYLNVGETHSFDLRLTNEGIAKDKLSVAVSLSDPTWSVRIEPGKRFALDPGQSAPFSVLLTPPADAKELDTVAVNLTATSDNDPKAKTTFVLRATITTLDVEANEYVPPSGEDAVPPDDKKIRESPVTAAPFLLVVAIGLVAWLRRP